MTKKDFFEGIVDKQIMTESGEVTLPLRSGDITLMMVPFPVKASRIRPLIPDGLKPMSVAGLSVCVIGCMEYRDLNIDPYNEVLLLVPVRYPGTLPSEAGSGSVRERIGFHVAIIAVNSQVSLDVGRNVWGYPKFLADIEFEETEGKRTCTWRAGEELIAFVSVRKKGIAFRYAGVLPDFSVLGNELVKNVLKTRFTMRISRGARAEFSFGPHPVGQKLAALIRVRRPLCGVYASGGKALLDLPKWGVPLP